MHSKLKKYNWAFHMTSFGYNEITGAGFNPFFIVQSQVYQAALFHQQVSYQNFAKIIYFIDNQ